MCLGDLRFMPHVVAKERTGITLNTTWGSILPRNNARVGILWGQENARVFGVWPFPKTGGSFRGSLMVANDTENPSPLDFTYWRLGRIIQNEWYMLSDLLVTDYALIELEATPDALKEIRMMGIK